MAKKNISQSNASSSRTRNRAAGAATSASQIDAAADMLTHATGVHTETATADGASYDDIAEAAYHRFLNRGGQDGGDIDDWVEAERELRSRR